MVFGKYDPKVLWEGNSETLTPDERKFLSTFPIWTYQAINNYNRRNPDNIIVRKQTITNVDDSRNEINSTFLDCILALIRFAQEHKNILLFKMQNLHSGTGRVNWSKTISNQQPFLKKGKAPIYLYPIIRKKEIDYEEELLVIYFSILRYINTHYGFQVGISLNFDLIAEKDLLVKYGTRDLLAIKYKYFSDITLHIWHLCYAFFEKKEKINSSSVIEDYLLAGDFDRIFESMVDELIGNKLPQYMKKNQDDGKEIDHLFLYKSLINSTLKTYYIADSKYYKIGHRPEGISFFKQYTYARNVIQVRNTNREKKEEIKLDLFRDDKTEGYNIIPNFFLSAYIEQDKLDYDKDGIEPREEQDDRVFHFPNRLFDRETLLVSHYDINFLYVIKQYANNGSKDEFREKVHKTFREYILKRLNGEPGQGKSGEYSFYVIELKQKPEHGKEQERLKDVLDSIFRIVNGKVFCPKKDSSYTNLILALENPERHITASKKELKNENQNVLAALEKDFIIHEGFKIGENIEDFLMKTAE